MESRFRNKNSSSSDDGGLSSSLLGTTTTNNNERKLTESQFQRVASGSSKDNVSLHSLNSVENNKLSKFYIKNDVSRQKKVVKHNFRWDNIPSSYINRDIVDIEGYTWDLIILLPNPDYHSYDRNKYKNQLTCELLAEKLTKGRLDYYFYYSIDKEEIVCKVRARLERLKEYAESAGKKLKLSETVIADEVDNKDSPIFDDPDICDIPPYEFIYANYKSDRNYMYSKAKGYGHGFPTCTRVGLLIEIIKAESLTTCGINLDLLVEENQIISYFPLHTEQHREKLRRDWVSVMSQPWQQPIDDIKSYFGVKVALYFEFLGHYTTWLLYLSVFSFFVFIDILAESGKSGYGYAQSHAYSIPFYCIFVSFWTQFMLEFWKRKEKTKSMEWGTTEFEEEELERPEFKGELVPSIVDGKLRKQFTGRYSLIFISNVVIGSMILLVVGCVSVIFVLQYYLDNDVSNVEEQQTGNSFASILNAVQIQLLNYYYNKLAVWLTNRENHRSDTDYEDSLIAKFFCFSFVNSYASFFYIAYIKSGINTPCVGSCVSELSNALAIIFITRLLVGKAQSFLLLYYGKYNREQRELKQQKEAKEMGIIYSLSDRSRVELEMNLDSYDPVMGNIENYAELAVQFGYVTLFVAAFPLAPVLAYASNFIEIRSDGYQLLYMTRRVLPKDAEDIGTWLEIFQIIAAAAVVTNSGLLCFTLRVISIDGIGLVWIFIGMQYFVFFVLLLTAYIIPDTPEVVSVQLKRQDYLADRAINVVSPAVDKEENSDMRTLYANTITKFIIHSVDDEVMKGK